MVEIPEVVVEELHTCLICEGETKDGRDLSFQGMKRAGLRYHYASCLYDSVIQFLKPNNIISSPFFSEYLFGEVPAWRSKPGLTGAGQGRDGG